MWSPDTADVITADQKSAQMADELWAALRAERDRLLTGSDWTQVADAPVDQAAWAAYRQTLRDLPDTVSDPANVDWPHAPVGDDNGR